MIALLIAGIGGVVPAAADPIGSATFHLEFGTAGITSLRRAGDVYDTEYLAAGGRLGRLLLRYRSTPNGDWRELPDLILTAHDATSVTYMLAAAAPSLAARSSGSAVTGAGGIRALNDGLVPPRADAPVFTWSGSRGTTQWVQYTFPAATRVSQAEVFWTAPPTSWRLLYAVDGQWKEVAARGTYGVRPNAFNRVEFDAVSTMVMRVEVTLPAEATVGLAEWRVGTDLPPVAPRDLNVREVFRLDGEALEWTITCTNETTHDVEIGDLAVPFEFAERTGARGDIYTRKLLRHALVAGNGSWAYWERANAVGPYLVVTPQDSAAFEYADGSSGVFTPYLHAAAAARAATAAGGRWRLPVSSLRLAPAGGPGASVTYRLRFDWARDARDVRDVLVRAGKFDTAVVPGMVVPSDLPAMIALRSNNRITAIVAEHPGETAIDAARGAAGIYTVRFSRLGENTLTVKYGPDRWTTLEFFVTEPLETVIRKRAAFLVSKQRHSDPSTWYYGAFGDWDQKNEVLRSPEDRDGLSTWLTDADDDAGNARPAFVASKNVYFPEQAEIDSLETYIRHYLWGGMQMTDRERYPYAIYGIPNWKANRESPDTGRNGQAHVWRIYDYPHIVLLYYRMYQIAKFYPSKVSYLDAGGYLERAYRTAVAYWTFPLEIERWSADAVGTMNEAIVPDLIDALESEGRTDWARTLRGYWEGKVDRFVNRTPNLYGSEFAFDSTGFESTGAFARYALTHPIASVSREAAEAFMDLQLRLNVADRGWLETTYYQLGSDYRGNLTYLLSYMSQMGGWSILDYALHFASDPTEYLRLGYASALSSWALVNSGTAASGYGYWYPGQNNDGAAGGGFMPDALGRTWIGKTMPRGAWYYSAEEDVGYCAALQTHTTIVTRDPVLGEIAYGGVLARDGDGITVIPRDGIRVRLDVVRDAQRLHLELDHDGFAREQRIALKDDLSRIAFILENRTGGAHTTRLTLTGLSGSEYTVTVAGTPVTVTPGDAQQATVVLQVPSAALTSVTIERRLAR